MPLKTSKIIYLLGRMFKPKDEKQKLIMITNAFKEYFNNGGDDEREGGSS